MYSNKLYTPLRYPGGKARFAPLIAKVIADNELTGGHYLEPYAGGAGVALSLLVDGFVGGCTEFCVNGLMAGNRRTSRIGYDRKYKEISTQRPH
jgi:hypothetical protein